MASKPELLQYQAADEIGQDFLLAYQRAVLLVLQQQGFLNEVQYKDCVQKLEKQAKTSDKSNSVKQYPQRRRFYVTSSGVLPRIHG